MGDRQGGAPGTGRRVEQRRLDEQHVALARRGAVAVDQPGRSLDQGRRQLARVPDRGRAAHDHRMRAVVGAQPEQPSEDVGDVATEHAAVGVELVDDDDPELLEELEPLRVVGQDRGVEHVRIGDHDLTRGPDRGPDRGRGVPVVCRGGDRQVGRPGKLRELGDLILAERLGREQEQCSCGRVLAQGLECRQRVAQRLAGRRRGHDHDVLALADCLDRRRLVDVQLVDPARGQGRPDPRIEPRREGYGLGRPGRDDLMVDDPAGQGRLAEDAVEDVLDGSGGVVTHRRPPPYFERPC